MFGFGRKKVDDRLDKIEKLLSNLSTKKVSEPNTPKSKEPKVNAKTELPKGFRRPIKKYYLKGMHRKEILQTLRKENPKSPFWNWCKKRNISDIAIETAIAYWKEHQHNGKKFAHTLSRRIHEQRTLEENLDHTKERHQNGERDKICKQYLGYCVPCNRHRSDFVKIHVGTDMEKLEKGYKLWKKFSNMFSNGHGNEKRIQMGLTILAHVQNIMRLRQLQNQNKTDSWGLSDPSPKGQMNETCKKVVEKPSTYVASVETAKSVVKYLEEQNSILSQRVKDLEGMVRNLEIDEDCKTCGLEWKKHTCMGKREVE